MLKNAHNQRASGKKLRINAKYQATLKNQANNIQNATRKKRLASFRAASPSRKEESLSANQTCARDQGFASLSTNRRAVRGWAAIIKRAAKATPTRPAATNAAGCAHWAPTTSGNVESNNPAAMARSKTRSTITVDSTRQKLRPTRCPNSKARPNSPRRKGKTLFRR